ncbi:hypothetical protein HYW74_00010 [Candidatus Pacearchaeota archaeon]|nr:hypothetical protein [Candidatus Pacearchaeota archaeon]
MNTKTAVARGLAGLLIGAGAVFPIAGNSFAEGNEGKTKIEQTEELQEKQELVDFGDNCLNEPDYVKIHLWTELTSDKEGWRTHVERYKDPTLKSLGNKFDSFLCGFSDCLRDIKGQKINPNGFSFRAYSPLRDQAGVEEYIEDNQGNFLCTFLLDRGEFIRVPNEDQSRVYTFYLKDIEKNPALLLAKNKAIAPLFPLIQLKCDSILKIKEFRKNEVSNWLKKLDEQEVDEIPKNPSNLYLYNNLIEITNSIPELVSSHIESHPNDVDSSTVTIKDYVYKKGYSLGFYSGLGVNIPELDPRYKKLKTLFDNFPQGYYGNDLGVKIRRTLGMP